MWVFGGISRLTGLVFARQIRNKRKTTLWPLMRRHIAPGSHIISDEHRSYLHCANPNHPGLAPPARQIALQMGFESHSAVKHSQTFVAPLPLLIPNGNPRLGRVYAAVGITRVKVHTNTLERHWRELKKSLRTCRSVEFIPNYIGEHLYRTNILSPFSHRRSMGHKFLEFLRDVSRVYPGPCNKPISLPFNQCYCPNCCPNCPY